MVNEILTTIWLILISLEFVLLIVVGLLNELEISEILFRITRALVISWMILTFLGSSGFSIYLVRR